MKKYLFNVNDMPFCLGPTSNPYNPNDLPNVFPFQFEINYELGRLEQIFNNKLHHLLVQAYKIGNEMGTPSDNTSLGIPYVEDFLRFIDLHTEKKGRLLEIGAGTGFLSKCLRDAGWSVESIEPGDGYKKYWQKYNVEVVNDFFPSELIKGKYDVIVFYTVLEHIKDTNTFLNNVKKHLKSNGEIFLAVPDCSIEIKEGDPAIFCHEHFQYFTLTSLMSTLFNSGLDFKIVNSSFGRSLYAYAKIGKNLLLNIDVSCAIKEIQNFIKKINEFKSAVNENIIEWQSHGRVGIYCPIRILNIISPNLKLEFFDDAENLHGKYYPPFHAKIKNRSELLSNPPRNLLIASRTFGQTIKDELLSSGIKSEIHLIKDVLDKKK